MKVVLAILALVVLAVVILVALPFLVDLNQYVEQYKPQIEDVLQRKVELKDIRLTMWPRLGARVAGFTIMDDPAFGTKPFASFTSLDVGVKLRPLLSGRVEVEEIALRDPVISVIKDNRGMLNVSTIGSKGPALPGEKKPQVPPSVPGEGPLKVLALLAVDVVSLTDGQLTYRDLSTVPKATEYVLQDFVVRLTDVQLGKTPAVHIGTVVQPLNLPLTIDGKAGPLTESGELAQIDATLGLGKTTLAMTGSLLGGQAKLTLTSASINSADVPIELPLSKPVSVRNLKIHVETPVPVPAEVSPAEVLTVQPMELDVVMGESTIALKGSVLNRRAKVLITSSAIKSGDLPIVLPLDKPVLIKDMKIQAETPFPPKPGAPAVESLVVQPMELAAVMGGSTVTVRGNAADGDIKAQATAPVLNTGDLPITIPALKKPVEIRKFQLAAQFKNNQARVTELSMQVFGGQAKGGAGVTLNTIPMPFDGKMALSGLQLGPLLDALGSTVKVSGTTAADLSLRGRGYTMAELTQAMEGTGHLAVKEGAIEGINLSQEVMTVLKVAGVSPDGVRTTAFSTIESDMLIKKGVVAIQRLLMDSHDFKATVQGTIGFDRSLNLQANLALSQQLSQKVGASSPVAKLVSTGGRLSVPMLIGGTTQAPTYALDMKALGGKVQEKLQEKVEAEAEKLLKGKSGEAVQKGAEALHRLFGR